MAINSREQVLKFPQRSRDTHVAWVEHYRAYPDSEDMHKDVAGSRRRNARLARQYQEVIDFIESNRG